MSGEYDSVHQEVERILHPEKGDTVESTDPFNNRIYSFAESLRQRARGNFYIQRFQDDLNRDRDCLIPSKKVTAIILGTSILSTLIYQKDPVLAGFTAAFLGYSYWFAYKYARKYNISL